jgi:hypothetical protein
MLSWNTTTGNLLLLGPLKNLARRKSPKFGGFDTTTNEKHDSRLLTRSYPPRRPEPGPPFLYSIPSGQKASRRLQRRLSKPQVPVHSLETRQLSSSQPLGLLPFSLRSPRIDTDVAESHVLLG